MSTRGVRSLRMVCPAGLLQPAVVPQAEPSTGYARLSMQDLVRGIAGLYYRIQMPLQGNPSKYSSCTATNSYTESGLYIYKYGIIFREHCGPLNTFRTFKPVLLWY